MTSVSSRRAGRAHPSKWKAPLLCCLLAASVSLHPRELTSPHPGETWYVAAPGGVNLREGPSTDAKKIIALPSRTPVQILEIQKGELTRVRFMDVRAGTSAPRGQMHLQGRWIRVRANNQTGYVFDALLVSFPPMVKTEVQRCADVSAYLVRAFALGRPRAGVRLIDEGEGVRYRESTKHFRSDSGISLEVTQAFNAYGWGNATLILPWSDLEKTIVFFVSILPVDALDSYEKGKSASYTLDWVPNQAEFRTDQGKTTVKWSWGAD